MSNQLSLFDVQSQVDIASMTDVDDILAHISNSGCTNCVRGEYRDDNNLQMAIYRGNPKADVWVVGKSPGVDDAKEGKPFSFGSGDKLRKLMAWCGLDERREVFWINPVFCPMADNAAPTARELAACSIYFDKLVSICRPKAFIAVGTVAYIALTGKTSKAEEIVGLDSPFNSKYNIPVWAIYHTAFWYKNFMPLDIIKEKTRITLQAFKEGMGL